MEPENAIYEQIESLINKGRYIEAARTSRVAITENPNDPKLIQLKAMAISKSGAPIEAASLLEPLYRDNPEDPETAGILGGIFKRIFMKEQDPEFGMRSYETYLKNYTETGSYYTGINAATMSALIGMAGKGRKIAENILGSLNLDDFWELATAAEAKLLLRDYESAVTDYREVRRQCGNDWGRVATIDSQLWLLNHYTTVPVEIRSLFKPPKIAAFVGHMVDHPDRKSPRFPNQLSGAVSVSMKNLVSSLGINIGYTSLACGSDILFAETMLELNGELSIILPFGIDDFLESSVSFAGTDWEERFHNIIHSQNIRYLVDKTYEGNPDIFRFLGKTIMGAAILRAQLSRTEPLLVSVLSKYDKEMKSGGTRDMIRFWPEKDTHTNVDIDEIRNQAGYDSSKDIPDTVSEPPIENELIFQIMLANVSHCSQDDLNDFLSKMDDLRANMINTPKFYAYGDDEIIFIHRSVMQVIDVLSELKEMEGVNVVIHSEAVEDSSHWTNGGEKYKFLNNILLVGKDTNVLVTGHFASQLAIESNKYTYAYAGVTSDVGNHEYDLFRLRNA